MRGWRRDDLVIRVDLVRREVALAPNGSATTKLLPNPSSLSSVIARRQFTLLGQGQANSGAGMVGPQSLYTGGSGRIHGLARPRGFLSHCPAP